MKDKSFSWQDSSVHLHDSMLFFPLHLQFPSKNKQHACSLFLKSSEPVLPSLQDILSEADVGIIKTHRQNLESSYRRADSGPAHAQGMDVGTEQLLGSRADRASGQRQNFHLWHSYKKIQKQKASDALISTSCF